MTDNNSISVIIDSDLEDLIPGFLENRLKDLEKLRNALSNSDFKTIQSIGHSLKGVGGGYGFDEISRLGAEIETAAKNDASEDIESNVSALENYLNNIEIKFE